MFLFSIVFLLGVLAGIYAQETDISSIDKTAELQETEGITPDSALYFFDEFLDRFGNDLNIREEKIAEIKAMIQAGKIEEAKIALQNYLEHAENLEEDVSPEESEEVRRSAAAIYNTLQEIENEIPDDEKEEFFDDVIEREGRIITASEIAGKIKELCETLSKIDPLEYSRVCKLEDDASDWQKKLDKDLTEEQRKEAIKFGEIMSQCFRTSGQECRCDEIPFTEFAEMCSIAAPLATACEIENDEEACEQLNNLEMPELPEHLQDVFDRLEGEISESQFESHMPKECSEAGATNPKECMRIMIQTHAPEECRDALIEANVQNEREAREICEEIMFEINAPEECIEAGLRDPKECGKLMFTVNAPEECVEAGLTGEHRSDEKKCREIMNGLERGEGNRGRGGSGVNCRQIENSEERLKCYDSALSGAEFEHFERRGPEGGFPEQCQRANALTRESCEQIMRGFAQEQQREFKSFEGQPSQCQAGQTFVCSPDGQCRCEGESIPSGEFVPPESFPQESPAEICSREGGNWDGSNCVFGSTTTEPTPSTTEGTTSTTGAIISGNSFLNYYF